MAPCHGHRITRPTSRVSPRSANRVQRRDALRSAPQKRLRCHCPLRAPCSCTRPTAPQSTRRHPVQFRRNGPIAQWLEQRTHNPLVPGSSPGGPTNRLNHLDDCLKVCESSKVRFRYGPDDEPYGRPCKWPPQVDRPDFPRRSVAALGRKLSSPVATWSRFDLSRICQIPSDALRRRAPAMTRAMPRPHEGQRVPTEAKPRTRAHTRQAHDPFRRRVGRTRRAPGSRRTTSGQRPSRPR